MPRVKKIKPVKAWGIVDQYGDLWMAHVLKPLKLHPQNRFIHVTIIPDPPKKRKVKCGS